MPMVVIMCLGGAVREATASNRSAFCQWYAVQQQCASNGEIENSVEDGMPI